MKKKGKSESGLEGEDGDLWRSVTSHIKPLNKRQGADLDLKPKIAPARKSAGGPATMRASPPMPRTIPKGSDIDRRTHDRVRRGERKIEARLDLHGLRQEEAHDRLMAFIGKSYAAQKRMLLIITGKGVRGEGVLRSSLRHWLMSSDLSGKILAIEPAQIKDGGSGAFYVFLRRER